jgi:aryl-alcohol dehydrogenase-like predicted oxidoreductase
MVDGSDLEKQFALLDAVFDQGCTTFDTAHVYSGGANERAVGRWVRERGIRDEVVIIGKGGHHNQDRRRVTPFDITADLHDSLARMQVDTIDLYLLHRDDSSVPVGPLVEVLNEHLRAGHIRAFGGSNWSHLRLREANQYALEHGLTPFVVSSPNFSLAEQFEEPWPGCISISGGEGAAARDFYLDERLALFTWSSLAGGFFSGRFTRDNLASFDAYLDRLCVSSYCYEPNFQRLERAGELAAAKDVTVTQIAMAYVLNQPLDLYALVGCQTPEEFAANAEMMALELSHEELTWLEEGD